MDSQRASRRTRAFGRVTATGRRGLWRTTFTSTGGLTVTGPAPSGPAIVVSNHCSHADALALIAALPASSRPVITPAADYWLPTRTRRGILRIAVSAVPVERGRRGAFDALRAALEPLLAQGRVVILFPEGGRNTEPELRRFQSGPWRLAEEFDVPLVPAAIVGTDRLWPKGRGLRRHAIEVRFGTPVHPAKGLSAKQIRAELDSLRDTITSLRQE